MPSIYDLYEFYLEARDLKEKAHVVQVQSVRAEDVFVQRARKMEKKIIVRFVNRKKAMILNKTQAGQMAEITGLDDYTKWVGAEVVLTAGRAGNGKDTIVICTREESGDVDLAFPEPWKLKYDELVKQIHLSPVEAKRILSECEDDYRTAHERLTEEYKLRTPGGPR